MAYAFNRSKRQEQPQKADIFAAEGQQRGAVVSAQGGKSPENLRAKQLPGTVPVTTDTAAPLAAGESKAPDVSPQQSAVKAVRAASEQPGQFPGIFGSIQGQIATANQGLQNEANAYVSGSTPANMPSREQIEAAIAGGDSRQSVLDALAGPQARAYTGPDFKTDTAIEDVGRVQSDTGLRELLAREQGPSYTGGMAAFDVAAMKKQKGFQDALRAAKGGQQALAEATTSLGEKAIAERKATETSAAEAAQKQTRDYLEAELARIDAQNQKEAEKANSLLSMVKQNPNNSAIRKMFREQVAKVQADVLAANPELAAYAKNIVFDLPQSYYTLGTADPASYMSADDVGRWQGISSLLGLGGTVPTAGAGGSWKDLISWDTDAIKAAISGQLGKKAQDAAAAKAQADAEAAAKVEEESAPIEFEEEKVYAKKTPSTIVPQIQAGQVAIDTSGDTTADLSGMQTTIAAPASMETDFSGLGQTGPSPWTGGAAGQLSEQAANELGTLGTGMWDFANQPVDAYKKMAQQMVDDYLTEAGQLDRWK
jgi:hypothetical protein